jgi:hypothetical protein
MDRIGREPHYRYADYFVGEAGELEQGDGFRLCLDPGRGRTVPVELDRPLVVVSVGRHENLVAVSLIDRSSMVDTALFGQPGGTAEVVDTLVFEDDETVLIRF